MYNEHPNILGIFTRLESDRLPAGFISNSNLMDFSSGGGISPLKQYTVFGQELATVGSITSVPKVPYKKTNTGKEIPLQVRDDGTSAFVEWYNSVADKWELLDTLTTGKTVAFAYFPEEISGTVEANTIIVKDNIYMCNGTDTMGIWGGAIGTVVSNTATVITMNETASTQGFLTGGGIVVVDGTEYPYSGFSGKTLTGLSGLPTFDVNEGVSEIVDTTTLTNIVKFDILHTAFGRIWGARSDSEYIGFTATGTANTTADWAAGANPQDAGRRSFNEGFGPITAITSIKDWVLIHKRDLVVAYKIVYQTATTRSENIKIIRQGDNVGAVNWQSIAQLGNPKDSIVYATANGGLKTIAASDSSDEEFIPDDVTDEIRPSLVNIDTSKSWVSWSEKQKTLVWFFKTTSSSTQNDRCLFVQKVRQLDGSYRNALGFGDWQFNCAYNYEGNFYGGASFEPNSFKLFDGYSKNNNPYRPLATFGRLNFMDNKQRKQKVKYILIEGRIGAGTTLQFELTYDEGGKLAQLSANFKDSETDFVDDVTLNTIGAFEIGAEPIGGTVSDVNELKSFFIPFELSQAHSPKDIQLTVYSEDAGNRWFMNPPIFIVEEALHELPTGKKRAFNIQ